MTAVIDIGAMHHEPEESTYLLCDLYHPEVLYAFDLGHWFKPGVELYEGTKIIRQRAAAWVSDGYVPYVDMGMCSGVVPQGERQVRSFDLARFILARGEKTILKLDCEGAEYVLLPHLRDENAARLIELLLVEWHAEHLANGYWVPASERVHLGCEELDWNDLTGLETVNR